MAGSSPAMTAHHYSRERFADHGHCGSPDRRLSRHDEAHLLDGAGSILRQGEDHAWRCNAAERMRSERDQRRLRLSGKRGGYEDRLAQRFAQPLQPADQIDGGADGGATQPIPPASLAPQNFAQMPTMGQSESPPPLPTP